MTFLNTFVQKSIECAQSLFTKAKERVLKVRKEKPRLFLFSAFGIFLLLFLYVGFFRPPSGFPLEEIVTIPNGLSLEATSHLLKEKNIIRSSFWFQNVVILFGNEKSVVAGDYFFKDKKNLFGIAQMIARGDFGLMPLRITIPEGSSSVDMAMILEKHLNNFDTDKFLDLAKEKEGYLFPDTYHFLPTISEREIVRVLTRTFNERMEDLKDGIKESGRSFDEIITMASIIEREANTPDSRRLVSGILWKRIELGIPLQVDVTFDYINGKNTFDLTLEDLRIDSPYNTYVNKGLPPGPISNPGIDSLMAAIYPSESDFLYFLADKDGIVHYSQTFEEHKKKKQIYLY